MRIFALFQVSVALFASTVQGYGADPEHGLALAKRWCASCHAVSPEQQRASADVPPFATIAKSLNFDAKRAATDDIAAYIATLK
jgi:mono/diheme cytochrome c family protein